ncbi:hypothetical protein [Streptomyces sp. TRM68367]|uniref:hypothetical protein n=1 Tax=Streptomyces sp. TRM68367 TaxID=2758415 RepID=UPI0037DD6114
MELTSAGAAFVAGARECLAADDPELALVQVTDGPRRTEYLAWSRFNPSPATRAVLDVLGVRPRAKQGLSHSE